MTHSRAVRAFLGGLALLIIFAFMPKFGRFVASPEWIVRSMKPVIYAAIAGAVAWLVLVALLPRDAVPAGSRRIHPLLLSPVLFLAGGLAAYQLPYAAAWLAGRPIGIVFTVKDLPQRATRCPRPIRLHPAGWLCSFPDSLRDTLYPGAQIVVFGKGTRMGVLAERVEIFDAKIFQQRRLDRIETDHPN
ncbi:hypothetical protein [Paracoccus shanxieyensis]|uniref:Uncharacterized protein n=1 Tax=Paracoccus shanxieyensis TaxID=2675752 RepID=A0A6L6ITN8_9RHOB|nr:hypothetical protein [Paracoccus shanxieyensis]MTH62712.1 hypothetical protein [Paracoccus shanxieyensis]MTH86204.1 hypothetical protein [Paracoccus shanxieyensis]